ncbi:hypothetical protein ACFVYF_06645 [Streptomyces sp. NPDC058274]|uniref:hypothetical protein n=1 Tax=Streptomyces sp. NPDC058274 TaxID=3346416 RepID=UPI0036EF307E
MYLIHVRLRAPGDKTPSPGLAETIALYAEEAAGLEHVSVHLDAAGDVTLGLFLVAARLAEAEESAARLVDRAVSDHPDLRGYRIVTAEAVLMPGPWWGTS